MSLLKLFSRILSLNFWVQNIPGNFSRFSLIRIEPVPSFTSRIFNTSLFTFFLALLMMIEARLLARYMARYAVKPGRKEQQSQGGKTKRNGGYQLKGGLSS